MRDVSARNLNDAALDLAALEQSVENLHLTPGWIARAAPIVAADKRTRFQPAHWPYAIAKAALDEAGHLVDLALAERRNLIMKNPAPGIAWETSLTHVCAYQMILPGEQAHSHRHSCNALRVIIEGDGAYSIVDGERMPMNSGDVVLTPGNCWHGHGHAGDAPAYWLDCLDVPLGHLLETMYFMPHPDGIEPVTREVSASPFRFTRDDIARGLDRASADPEGRFGPSMELPTPGMASTGLVVFRLGAGVATRRRRSTANRIYSVMAGSGVSKAASVSMAWTRGDTFHVPSGVWFEHRASDDAQLVEMSDAPLMRFINHFREELE
jgi:gentisate 1,2-dioxygenase